MQYGRFVTEFGFVELREQEVGSTIRILPPEVFPALQSSMVNGDGFVVKPNASFIVPATQPSADHVRDYRCETYGKYPASRVFPALTGDAVDVSCQSSSDDGIANSQVREAYLYDYNISVRLLDIDDDGLTVSRVRNVTIVR